MTTKFNHSTASTPRPHGDHWSELSATISSTAMATLEQWFDEQLSQLELRNQDYVTKHSLRKNLRG